MPMERFEPGPWALAALTHLDQAIAEIHKGGDAIPAVTAALAALRTEVGEQTSDAELDELLGPEPCDKCGERQEHHHSGECPPPL